MTEFENWILELFEEMEKYYNSYCMFSYKTEYPKKETVTKRILVRQAIRLIKNEWYDDAKFEIE